MVVMQLPRSTCLPCKLSVAGFNTAVIDSSIKSPTMNLTFLMRHSMLRASFFVSSDCHVINCSTARTTNGNSSLRTLNDKCLSVNRVTHKVISLALFCLSFGPDLIWIILFNSSTRLYRTHIKCCQLCWYFNAHCTLSCLLGYRTLWRWTLWRWTLWRKTLWRLTLWRQSPKRWTHKLDFWIVLS